MAFTALTTAEVATGEPIAQGTKIKDNFDDLDSRLSDLEVGWRKIQFYVDSRWLTLSAATGILFDRLPVDATVTDAHIVLLDTGTSGTLEVDLQYKRGAAAFASIFSTRPSLTSSAAQFDLSTNQVIGTSALQAGDIIRFDVVTAMTGNDSYLVELFYDL